MDGRAIGVYLGSGGGGARNQAPTFRMIQAEDTGHTRAHRYGPNRVENDNYDTTQDYEKLAAVPQ